MSIHNVRSPEQWEIISRHVDFNGKTVLDLGCGKGDILFRAIDAGAEAFAIDYDEKNIRHIQDICSEIKAIVMDIDLLTTSYPTGLFANVVICFSVLPYLKEPDYALKWINHHSDIALIECQYAGDGPGFHFLANNDDMENWLLDAGEFEKISIIGSTLVEGRDKLRFIWRCE